MAFDDFVSSLARTIVLLVSTMTPIFCQVVPGIPAPDSSKESAEPVPLENILRYLAKKRSNPRYFPESVLIKEIERRGLGFQPNSEDLAAIKKAGASDSLRQVIENTRKPDSAKRVEPSPEPPEAPPKVKEGYLLVACQPGECEVLVNGKVSGTAAQDGSSPIKLPVGQVTVTVRKKDHEPDRNQETVFIRENETARIEFKFKMSQAVIEAAGAKLFSQMLEALGGQEGLEASRFVRVTGTINVYGDRDEKPVAWSLTALIRMPDMASFEVTRAGKNYEIVRKDNEYFWKKIPAGKEFENLEDALRQVQEYQIARILERLRGGRPRMVVAQPPLAGSEGVILRAEGNPETHVITMNSDFRPKEVKLESTGLNSGLKVLFADYVKEGKAFYPRSTQIVFPWAKPHGLEAQFDKVEINPVGFKESSFAVKKGVRFRGH